MLNLLSNRWMRSLRYAFALLTIAALTACGGGGGGASPFAAASASGVAVAPAASGVAAVSGVVAASGVGAVMASKIQLLVSSPQLPSAGTTPVTLTAVVLSAANQTMAGRTVTFSIPPTETAFTSYITPNGVSDANGLVTATLNLGANKANRIITVSAIVDGVSTIGTIDVVGTTVSIAGNGSLALNALTNLSITVKDSAGAALSNIPVLVASAMGNTLTIAPISGLTGASGIITASVKGVVPGADTITATAGGASATSALTVSADAFAFQNATAIPPEIALSALPAFPVSVLWKNASGVAVANQLISFTSGRGAILPLSASTNASGVATTMVGSTSAGAATITATGPGGTPSASLPVIFVATIPNNVTTQAVPGIIQITTASAAQTNNNSVISAVVRDAAGNLVKNAKVKFLIVADTTGGTLNPATATAITDINGLASVTYTAGATSSPQNGVTISATVVDVAGVVPVVAVPPGMVNLTVSTQPLFLRIGFDNLISVAANPPTNSKIFAAIVTDTAGNAVSGQTVRFVIRPTQFRKGFYSTPTPAQIAAAAALVPPIILTTGWVQNIAATCRNEDLNSNDFLDAGEDFNGDLALTPGAAASITATGITDANGIATATMTYLRSFATWVQVRIEARTGVVGNDPPTSTQPFWLTGLATDYTALPAPPDVFSPFGTSTLAAFPAKIAPAGFANQNLGCDNPL